MGRSMTNTDAICLRPVEERDLLVLGRIDTDPAMSAPFSWRGYRDSGARRRRWEADGYLGRDDSLLWWRGPMATSPASSSGDG